MTLTSREITDHLNEDIKASKRKIKDDEELIKRLEFEHLRESF